MARLGPAGRAADYYARRRTKGLRSVTGELFKTHDFATGATSIDTGDSFGTDADRTRPVTFRWKLKRTTNTVSGTVLQLGSASRRTSVTVSNDQITVLSGSSGGDQVALVGSSALVNRLESDGTAQAGAPTTITLAAGESDIDDIYVGTYILITGGTGTGQARPITDYDGTTKVATVGSAWTTDPDNTSDYDILTPLTHEFTLSIEPNDGRVTLWRNGVFFKTAQSVSGDFNGAWCDDDATGLVGGSLTDVDMTPLEVFNAQRPARRRT
jgi:hypothetical protein